MKITKEMVIKEVSERIEELTQLQGEDGAWRFCFEGGLLTDAFMIILLRSLNIRHEELLINQLSNRLMQQQTNNGIWTSSPDKTEGNLSATVQAYTALLYSGHYTSNHPKLKRAELYIRSNGGISKTHFMTKWMLAANGLYRWPTLFYIPMTFLLTPSSFPINIYQLSTYARIHFIPMMITANKKFTIQRKDLPNLDHLHSHRDHHDEWNLSANKRSNHYMIIHEMRKLNALPNRIHQIGYKRAEHYMMKRIENDGMLYSYASATFFMIYALLALGYNKEAPIIQHAINGLKQHVNFQCNGSHLENSTSTIWDTALVSYALQEANIQSHHPMIKKATKYLLSRQHINLGDWAIHNPNVKPGGWGFSHSNSINPDNDDTSAALRALTRPAHSNQKARTGWYKGVTYLLSMQNTDGGWAAFEKNTDSPLFTYLPLENAKDAAIDPSTPDLTGRVLEFLGNFAGLTVKHPSVKAGVNWLLHHQQTNGSWYGRWGVCYVYGTWAAVTGLLAVGVHPSSEPIKKAINWLETIQLPDGGWGESCKSCEENRYIELPYSTPSQTAWAIDAIIQAEGRDRSSVDRGLSFLLKKEKKKQALSYPTGIGLPGQFYIHYHSYNKLFPLLAFAHYLQK